MASLLARHPYGERDWHLLLPSHETYLTKRNDLSLHVTVLDRPLLLVIIGVVLLEPLTEEIYFRGILFCGLKSKMNAGLSAGIVTAIFAFLHPQHQLIVLPVALTLGAFRVVGRSTCSCFALHLVYNLTVLLWGVR
jgi:membrane protease YdiL (CAAX protease family)